MKKNKKIISTIVTVPLNIYRRSVVIFFGMTMKEIADYGKKNGVSTMNDKWVEDMELTYKNSTGITAHFGDDNPDIMIAIHKRPERACDYGVLYHELYHAVDMIASQIDPMNTLNDRANISEAKAYLYEYLATECNKVLW